MEAASDARKGWVSFWFASPFSTIAVSSSRPPEGNNFCDSSTKRTQDGLGGGALIVVVDISADRLRVFGDESFDEKEQRVAAVAGLIGTEKQWNSLVDKWTTRTGGKEFHANECETEHAKKSDEDKHKNNLQLYADLMLIIATSGLRGVGIAVDLISFREHFPGTKNETGFYKCFADLINHCWEFATTESKQIEEFTMDNREEKEYNASLIYQYYMQRPEWEKNNIFRTSKLSFDTRQNPRIQAADLMARETMKFLDNNVGPVRRTMRKSLEAFASGDGLFLFKEYEGPYFKGWREKMDELEKRGGMSMRDYARWLVATGQQDNWSNRFHFIIWLETRGP